MKVSDQPKNIGELTFFAGPSFKNEVPEGKEWADFLSYILNDKGKDFANLWLSKAESAGGVPLRKDLEFTELVKFGTNIFMAKLDENKKWVTTYCGTDLVAKTNYDSTGEFMDNIEEENIVEFWHKNLEIIINEHRPLIEFNTLLYVNKEHIHTLVINFPLKSRTDIEPDIFIALELFDANSFVPKHLKLN